MHLVNLSWCYDQTHVIVVNDSWSFDIDLKFSCTVL